MKEVKAKVAVMRPLILVSAPWALYNRPSIQLGALKAHLRQCFPDLPVRAEHFHLQAAAHIGYPLYQAVSERTWIAECVAAALLFPEQAPRIEQLFARESRQSRVVRQAGLPLLTSALEDACDRFIDGICWGDHGLAGFSVSLCQLTASLYLIRRIKARFPALTVVVGGSTFSGESFETLTGLFPEINHLIRGEGETALADLADAVCRNGAAPDESPLEHHQVCQIQDLDSLPAPDFDEYFALLQSLAREKRFFPVLPVEASRGCWWQKTVDDSSARGCAFCNLNLQWRGYRAKSAGKIVAEIEHLSDRHKVLAFSFMDNLLPRKGAGELFVSLADSGKQYRLFGEIRADTPANMLAAMRRVGMRELQVGVEALSSRLLARMNKGSSALDNIEMMRHCEALGMHHGGNLLMSFPGSTAEEIRETLDNLEYAAHFRPLKPVSFWLGLESPVFQRPDQYGIRLTGNDPRWSALFPASVIEGMRLMIQGYSGSRGAQRRMWAPVAARVQQWSREYDMLMRGPDPEPVLGYQDGRDFLIITQRKAHGTSAVHRLPQASRQVYLFCRTSRSREQIQARFPRLPADKLENFLRMMLDKRLMFEEGDRFLSLAVPLERGAESPLFEVP
ncbi:ribosomal peptide maturation radical SAM protein 1 [Desulfonatronum thiosulfatophilum]|uniref:Ribosomal peptide maturation radical SAM protein 1 n=1 Tax=Desulfonatronum thiosulfatophilum TaxID=617002 RepID=A0A1G6CHP6_9BACT|nr:RiPP maturation radical SAM C-methyltransferase [Desulfonatronum thiosulfatophilum]SDB32419.1 ribosomal peptide maturation radical SAM protein 1 [Desulfonatronum thiosulfatophilum]